MYLLFHINHIRAKESANWERYTLNIGKVQIKSGASKQLHKTLICLLPSGLPVCDYAFCDRFDSRVVP